MKEGEINSEFEFLIPPGVFFFQFHIDEKKTIDLF